MTGFAGQFMTFPLAQKRGFLKEEGIEAEIIRISAAQRELGDSNQERNAPDGLREALTDPSRKGGADYPYQHQAMTGFLSRLQEKPLGRIPVFSKAGPLELPSTVPV